MGQQANETEQGENVASKCCQSVVQRLGSWLSVVDFTARVQEVSLNNLGKHSVNDERSGYSPVSSQRAERARIQV